MELIPETISQSGTLQSDGKTIRWQIGFIGAGETRTVSFSCRIPPEAQVYRNSAKGNFEDGPEEEMPSNEVELENFNIVEFAPEIKKTIAGETTRMVPTFTFVLNEGTAGEDILYPEKKEITIKGGGKESFAPIVIYKVGRYEFSISETPQSFSGWDFDRQIVKYSILAEEDESGRLVIRDFEKNSEIPVSVLGKIKNSNFQKSVSSPREKKAVRKGGFLILSHFSVK